MLVPGFIDSHIHFIDGGFGLASVQLRDAQHASGVRRPHRDVRGVRRRPERGSPDGNWDHELWGGELPRRDWIDSVTPNVPVWINRLDGHMGLANSAALARGWRDARDRGCRRRDDRARRDRRADGRAQGQRDGSRRASSSSADPTSRSTGRSTPRCDYVAEQGVTSVHHMGTWADLAVFERAHAAGRLRTRIYAAVPSRTLGAAPRYRGGARPRRRMAQASARSRDSSTARSARTPRRSSSPSPTRRTIVDCS